MALFFSCGLRWWSILHHNPRADANTHAERRSIAYANSDPQPEPKPNAQPIADTDAILPFRCAFLVGKRFERCGKLQHLPVNSVFWALH